VGFWELNGDPRELERIVRAGGEQAVLLTADELQMRWYLASGHKVEAAVLAALGFVEAREDARYRVRGMSRQLEAVAERVRLRDAGLKGGKASAEARRKKHGSAQPGGPPEPVENPETAVTGRSEGDSAGAQPPVEALSNHPPKHSRSTGRSTPEAAPNPEVRGKRLEVRGEYLSSPPELDPRTTAQWEDAAADWLRWASSQAPELATPGPTAQRWAVDFFQKYQHEAVEHGQVVFAKFLVWCATSGRTVGWGLWLREAVWEPRWADVRAEARAARGAA
jgi:hypothetical protein